MKKLSGVFICLLLFTFISSARIIEVADAGITDKLRAVIAAKNAGADGGSAWFGYETIGSVDTVHDNVFIRCSAMDTPANSGTVSIISIYSSSAGSGSLDVKVGLYDDNSGTPGNKIGTETEFVDEGEWSLEWHEFSVSYSVTGSTSYWICLDTSSDNMTVYYDADAGANSRHLTSYPDAWPATWSESGGSASELSYKAYYTW